MLLTRKQFLNIAGPGALGAAAHSVLGTSSRAEAQTATPVSVDPGMRYSFQASAVALGGQMDIPYPDILEVQAPTTLPPSGGRGSAHVENYRYGQMEGDRFLHIVSFEAAITEVFGNERIIPNGAKDGTDLTFYETLATVTVNGVKIGELDKEQGKKHLIKVKKIVGQLTSQHRSDDPENPLEHVNSKIEGLEIDGESVPDPIPHGQLSECKKFSQLVERMNPERMSAEKGKKYEGFEPPVLDHKGKPLKWTPPPKWDLTLYPYPAVTLKTTIFKEPLAVPKGCGKPGGGRIEVGRWLLTLGELEIKPQSRRLTMLRVDMKPNMSGVISLAAVEGNGSRG